ncbi:16S rRNA (uracil(1498)-N(3))-methyltransferase [Methylobacillus sp. MM3]|uniref:16S rRNA (uracil(1498)-N(3))-methyltransferase n=1 Tax=Methylobacillus sp. MM3 TaxID=1848039 RepID=UPI0007E0F689|nr:16S rRNA (uracil(1498)-N(3))-methyltransferase [Methylobacillus sp. MM3]OAJ70777.1 16S rRNA (uracil(1498)-N(3))-methyltransferase [Methylobacillus sp. MM3]
MPSPRFFCDAKLGPGAQLDLPESAAHHAQRVLRLKAGDQVTLFNGDGYDYTCELLRVGKDGVSAKVSEQTPVERESPLNVTLAQCISSGDRMDLTLQKSVELGIARIQPLAAERSVVKLSGERAEKRVQHWQNVVISACEQSGRSVVPEVLPPLPLTTWLAQTHDFELKLMLDPFTERRLHELSPPKGSVCLLIGCEGGFSPSEQTAALHAGFMGIRLGQRILRTETAGLAALAALQTLWGDF